MSKEKIFCYLPIHAWAKFSIEKPENWDDLTEAERTERFLESPDIKREASLCHQCSRDIESDFEVNLDNIENQNDELDWWEE